jgi:hypothetical protein
MSPRAHRPIGRDRRPRAIVLVLAAALGAASAASLGGCGPSATQVREAREARYPGPRDHVFAAVERALGEEHPIATADPAQGVLVTDVRWFDPEGFHEDRPEITVGGEREVVSTVHDGSLRLAYVVRVVPAGPSSHRIVVEPEVVQYRVSYKALRPMAPDDPELPGWVGGKVDALALALHRRLQPRLAPPGLTPAAP